MDALIGLLGGSAGAGGGASAAGSLASMAGSMAAAGGQGKISNANDKFAKAGGMPGTEGFQQLFMQPIQMPSFNTPWRSMYGG